MKGAVPLPALEEIEVCLPEKCLVFSTFLRALPSLIL